MQDGVLQDVWHGEEHDCETLYNIRGEWRKGMLDYYNKIIVSYYMLYLQSSYSVDIEYKWSQHFYSKLINSSRGQFN